MGNSCANCPQKDNCALYEAEKLTQCYEHPAVFLDAVLDMPREPDAAAEWLLMQLDMPGIDAIVLPYYRARVLDAFTRIIKLLAQRRGSTADPHDTARLLLARRSMTASGYITEQRRLRNLYSLYPIDVY